jgi:DNA-binding NarL/FixJ family response regulator
MGTQPKPIRVLLVDDSLAMLWGLGKLVRGEAPRLALVGSARSADEALVYARLRPDVIVLDLELDGASSADLIPPLRQRSGGRVLILTGLGDCRLHEDALLFGAAGLVRKDEAAGRVLDAIEGVHAGRYWGIDPRRVSAPRGDDELAAFAAAGMGFLSPAERAAIVRLHDSHDASPPALAELLSIYNKLGLRNRLELDRFARRFGAGLDD